ncbi:hypothetical protein SNEBB_000797 [Seison nebaliae]|nr:hypothetical protein SNEBB_000797 [Seison nebaliae]
MVKLLPMEYNVTVEKFLLKFQNYNDIYNDEPFSSENLIKQMEEEIEKNSQVQSNACLQIIQKFTIPMVLVLNDEWPRNNHFIFLGRFLSIHRSKYDSSDEQPKTLPHNFSISFALLNDDEEVIGTCIVTRLNYRNKEDFLKLNGIMLDRRKANSISKTGSKPIGYRWNYLEEDRNGYHESIDNGIEMFLLESFIIKRSERGKGYGKQMLNRLETFLKSYLKMMKCKYICIYLTTLDQMKFYENSNYQLSKTKFIVVKSSTSLKLRNNPYLNSLQNQEMTFQPNTGNDLAFFKLLKF